MLDPNRLIREAGIRNGVATVQHRPEICGTRFTCHGPPFSENNYGGVSRIPKISNRAISIVSRSAFILAARGPAFAADMAVKTPPPAPALVYSWTGWYAGVNVDAERQI